MQRSGIRPQQGKLIAASVCCSASARARASVTFLSDMSGSAASAPSSLSLKVSDCFKEGMRGKGGKIRKSQYPKVRALLRFKTLAAKFRVRGDTRVKNMC